MVVHSSTEPIGRRRCHRQWDAYNNFVNLEDLSVQSPKTLIWVWCLRCTSESQTKERKKEKSTTLKFQPFHHGCCSSNTGRRSRLWSWKKGQIRAFPCRHKDERHYLQPPGTSVTDSSAQRPSSSTHTSWHPHRTMMRLRASGSELSRYLQLYFVRIGRYA